MTQAQDQAYKYNASDAELNAFVKSFTSRVGDGDIEEDYLGLLRVLAHCKAGGRFLEIGAGLGRIVDLVKAKAGLMVALEPDVERFAACHRGHHDEAKVRILNGTSADYRARHPEDRFDLIIVSMVLQHVATDVCAALLDDLAALLAVDGVGVVATTHFLEERFTTQREPACRGKQAFDAYAHDIAGQHAGIPVRLFSQQSLAADIDRAGLTIVNQRPFCYFRPEALPFFAGLYGVDADRLRDCAASQYGVVARKT
ncbi:methyltransferase domain-containing protein [Rhodoblastus acidophilus]|jgi:2-polyprenyl-3-methyl-5-hydroxy-6-metoxy-1,4-benzoquinol methylase|uniref:Methyltransferase domain-containing protein n=1 Tax=Rhodoblastus acidophilus TaxID=1074 RepID=A0A6N8DHF9_RHOAC|nr:methyltransferase domain-containing protein [Rhodoblastus acidophilus]MCW2272925.1 2-polyprenyl-3-methyl-5-hydroxy-6-metoxy-1,4-benzoquinol methylase [Rhodoblastus acidophilus]MTV29832.1 methyltransferase domain-containing protein [Rhodoblastus acidophilus]